MSENTEALSVVGLTKSFRDGLLAVDHISFSIKSGEIFGFLGLNGAGKTTTIKMLSTLIRPTSGSIQILGYDAASKGLEIRKRIGVVQQKESYDRNLSVSESLRLYASLWSLSKEESSKRIEALLSQFDLLEVRNRRIRWLSFGQRRRLQVAREFLHDSSLLILDEPTAGMDVLSRHAFLDLCKETARVQKTTIFYTTHIVSEAEYLCDRVAIIDRGKMIALDSPEELKRRYGGFRTVLLVARNSRDYERFMNLVEQLSSNIIAKEGKKTNNEVSLTSKDPIRLANDASLLLAKNGLEPESISIVEPSLENVLLSLFGDKAKVNEGSGKQS